MPLLQERQFIESYIMIWSLFCTTCAVYCRLTLTVFQRKAGNTSVHNNFSVTTWVVSFHKTGLRQMESKFKMMHNFFFASISWQKEIPNGSLYLFAMNRKCKNMLNLWWKWLMDLFNQKWMSSKTVITDLIYLCLLILYVVCMQISVYSNDVTALKFFLIQ